MIHRPFSAGDLYHAKKDHRTFPVVDRAVTDAKERRLLQLRYHLIQMNLSDTMDSNDFCLRLSIHKCQVRAFFSFFKLLFPAVKFNLD